MPDDDEEQRKVKWGVESGIWDKKVFQYFP